jgi:hypothetical protein
MILLTTKKGNTMLGCLRFIIYCFLVFPLIGQSQNPSQENFEQSLLEVFPNSTKLLHVKGVEIFRFCPDNTCVEFQQKRRGDLVSDGLIYLYFLGDYYELKKWRESTVVQTSVHDRLNSPPLLNCKRPSEMLADCVAKELRKNGLRVSNLRFDEGKEIRSKIW